MSASLNGPPGVFAEPGPDQEPQSLGYHLRSALAIIGRDGQLTPDEMTEVKAFMVGMEAVGQQRAAGLQPEGPMTPDMGQAVPLDEGNGVPMEEPTEGASPFIG